MRVLIDNATRAQPEMAGHGRPVGIFPRSGDRHRAVPAISPARAKSRKATGLANSWWIPRSFPTRWLTIIGTGKLTPNGSARRSTHIFSMQLPDGGWNIYHGGPSEVNATIKAYLALKLAGVAVTDPRMLKAREGRAAFRRCAAHESRFPNCISRCLDCFRGNMSRRFRARCCSSANGLR